MSYDRNKFTNANESQLNARDKLFKMSQEYTMPDDEKERSTALFLRASQLARFMAISEVYETIVSLPGAIFDLGTWRGSTAVLCENYRAIYEPMNFQRHIYAFDTFEGYRGFKEKEANSTHISNGAYSVENSYNLTLSTLLNLHEQNNAMGHINGKHQVIKGDARKTVKELLNNNPGLSIALSFFDFNNYQATKESIIPILERTPIGGVIAIWQFTRKEIQAEAQLFFEIIHKHYQYEIKTSKFYSSLTYITIKGIL